VSIPSQRDLTTRHCLSNGWTVVGEYVEPGVSATDDRRPVFQAMLGRACDADHPYDVIVVHSFSRFFRDGATMKLTIRKLRRHGVEVVSMTQPTGTDPSQEMMRQIIGIFDEYTSKENGKNVTRAMKGKCQTRVLERCLTSARLHHCRSRTAGAKDQEAPRCRAPRGRDSPAHLSPLRGR
jgi:site-specific DNA recombinase